MENKACQYKGCERSPYYGARGCCINHYSMYFSRVKRGKTTWKELEKNKLVLPMMSQEEKNKLRHHKYKKRSIKIDTQVNGPII